MEPIPSETVTMKACILRVCCCDLLVCDLRTSQQVLIHTPSAWIATDLLGPPIRAGLHRFAV